MNDRPQGGSSLFDGQIELMQHRRISTLDGKGMGYPLNEVDQDFVGVTTHVTYYVQINSDNMRQIQQSILDGPQIFYTREKDMDQKNEEPQEYSINTQQLLGKLGSSNIRSVIFPLFNFPEKTLLIRLENLSDVDEFVNVRAFVDMLSLEFYKKSKQIDDQTLLDLHSESFLSQSKIEEVVHTGTFTVKHMRETKLRWKKDVEYQEPQFDSLLVKPLGLRSFRISFSDNDIGEDQQIE